MARPSLNRRGAARPLLAASITMSGSGGCARHVPGGWWRCWGLKVAEPLRGRPDTISVGLLLQHFCAAALRSVVPSSGYRASAAAESPWRPSARTRWRPWRWRHRTGRAPHCGNSESQRSGCAAPVAQRAEGDAVLAITLLGLAVKRDSLPLWQWRKLDGGLGAARPHQAERLRGMWIYGRLHLGDSWP